MTEQGDYETEKFKEVHEGARGGCGFGGGGHWICESSLRPSTCNTYYWYVYYYSNSFGLNQNCLEVEVEKSETVLRSRFTAIKF